MIVRQLSSIVLAGLACAGFAAAASAEARHHHVYPGSDWPVAMLQTGKFPVASHGRVNIHVVVPVVPTVLGIRPAPVGQPVVYVIEQPERQALRPGDRRLIDPQGTAAPASREGPRILQIKP